MKNTLSSFFLLSALATFSAASEWQSGVVVAKFTPEMMRMHGMDIPATRAEKPKTPQEKQQELEEAKAKRFLALLEKVAHQIPVPTKEVEFGKAYIDEALKPANLKKAALELAKEIKERGIETDDGEVIVAPGADDEEIAEIVLEVMEQQVTALKAIRRLISKAKTSDVLI